MTTETKQNADYKHLIAHYRDRVRHWRAWKRRADGFGAKTKPIKIREEIQHRINICQDKLDNILQLSKEDK